MVLCLNFGENSFGNTRQVIITPASFMKHTELVLVSLRSFWTLPLRDGLLGSDPFLQGLREPATATQWFSRYSQAGLLCEKGPCHLQDRVEFEDRDGN